MKPYLFIFLILTIGQAQAQIERGQLMTEKRPDEIQSYVSEDTIELVKLRELTDFLTNPYVTSYQGVRLPKRKKAFIRHIKHISEAIEYHYQKGDKINHEVIEHLLELIIFETAFIEKAMIEVKNGPSFLEKIKLMLDYSVKSKFIFKYKIINSTELLSDPPSSPYWKPNQSTPYKQFKLLAKAKKIRPKKKMFILFDKFSYSGSAPKIWTKDLDLDNEWSLKWGDEVHTDVVGSRIFAALGYDVDHPYFYTKNQLTLIFGKHQPIQSVKQLCDSIQQIYHIDLNPFVSEIGQIDSNLITKYPKLMPYYKCHYVRFLKCAIEARPDRVKRIGPFMPNHFGNVDRRSLKGSVLAHAFIGNWDTRVANTLITTVHDGNYNYRISAVFSDLGTSLGVKISPFSQDFKAGLVNELEWELCKRKGDKLILNYKVNLIWEAFKRATYDDLKWMALKIHNLDESTLRKIIRRSGWPKPIADLYFHKLASRRASILRCFDIKDEFPIEYDRNLNVALNGKFVVKSGVLIDDFESYNHPESFLHEKGRFRNYGH